MHKLPCIWPSMNYYNFINIFDIFIHCHNTIWCLLSVSVIFRSMITCFWLFIFRYFRMSAWFCIRIFIHFRMSTCVCILIVSITTGLLIKYPSFNKFSHLNIVIIWLFLIFLVIANGFFVLLLRNTSNKLSLLQH